MNKKLFIYGLLSSLAIVLFFLNSNPLGTQDSSNIRPSKVEVVKLNRFEQASREASVKVTGPSGGHGTGTLVDYYGTTVVFTAKHVTTEGPTYIVTANNGEYRKAQLFYTDSSVDFSVLLVDDFETIKPVKFKKHNYNSRNFLDLNIIFSGYPSTHSLLTSRGRVAGYEYNSIIVHAVAWAGSSGSSIFSSDGNFIGILFGVSTDTPFGFPTIIDNIIWVVPYYNINWAGLNSKIEELE